MSSDNITTEDMKKQEKCVVTTRMLTTMKDQLEAEAKERGITRHAYVLEIIEARHQSTADQEQANIDLVGMIADELDLRFDDLNSVIEKIGSAKPKASKEPATPSDDPEGKTVNIYEDRSEKFHQFVSNLTDEDIDLIQRWEFLKWSKNPVIDVFLDAVPAMIEENAKGDMLEATLDSSQSSVSTAMRALVAQSRKHPVYWSARLRNEIRKDLDNE